MSQLGTPLGGRGKKFCGNLPRNLRAELPQLERDKLVAEWCRLVGKEVSVQVAQKPQGGRPKGGESEAARQLGLDRDDVRRAIAVVALSLAGQK